MRWLPWSKPCPHRHTGWAVFDLVKKAGPGPINVPGPVFPIAGRRNGKLRRRVALNTFVEAVRRGNARPGDIDDWVGFWHGQDGLLGISLDELLGFTPEQGGRWAEGRRTTEDILEEILGGRPWER